MLLSLHIRAIHFLSVIFSASILELSVKGLRHCFNNVLDCCFRVDFSGAILQCVADQLWEVCSSVETGVAGELKSVLLVACQMLGARQIQHLWNTPALSAAKDLQMNGCCKGM